MSMANTYRQRANQARQQIASLQKEKGNLSKKSADLQKRANTADAEANKTKNASTRTSKLREAERARNDLASIANKIGTIENKIATEHLKLQSSEKSLVSEEAKEAKKRQRNAEQLNRTNRQQMNTMNSQIRLHGTLHREAFSEIDKLKNLPDRITVLFLASNPLDQSQLRLDEEIRAIQEMIRKSEHRDAVHLESRWALRPQDVLQAFNECNPHIVHFSGHGTDTDEIVFQDDFGRTKSVTKEALVQVMNACSGNLQLAFFNTCYSAEQAEAVVEHVQAAVGMSTSIGDRAARVFASQFYSAIGFGKSLAQAFEQGKAELMLENIPEDNTPELFVADDVDPEQLILVRPPDSS